MHRSDYHYTVGNFWTFHSVIFSSCASEIFIVYGQILQTQRRIQRRQDSRRRKEKSLRTCWMKDLLTVFDIFTQTRLEHIHSGHIWARLVLKMLAGETVMHISSAVFGTYFHDIDFIIMITVKPEIFACPLFREFHLSKFTKIMGREYSNGNQLLSTSLIEPNTKLMLLVYRVALLPCHLLIQLRLLQYYW